MFSWISASSPSAPPLQEREKWLGEVLEPNVKLKGPDIPVLKRCSSHQELGAKATQLKVSANSDSDESEADKVSRHATESSLNVDAIKNRPRRSLNFFKSSTQKRNASVEGNLANNTIQNLTRTYSSRKASGSGSNSEPFTLSTTQSSSHFRFKSLQAWKNIFESDKKTEERDLVETWMVRKFFAHASGRMEKKLLLGSLEKMSTFLTLLENQMRRTNDMNFGNFLNCLNAYLLCLRFGAATTKSKLDKKMSQKSSGTTLSTDDESRINFSLISNIPGGSQVNKALNSLYSSIHFHSVSLTSEELSKNRALMAKANRKKTRINYLQNEALNGVFESLIALIIDAQSKIRSTSDDANLGLDADMLGTWLVDSFEQKFFQALDENKSFVSECIKGITSLNQFICEPSVYTWFFAESCRNLIENRWNEVVEYLKVACTAFFEFIKEEFIVKYLKKLKTFNMLNKKWKFDAQNKIIFDEFDMKCKEELKELLENMYIRVEHFVSATTKLSMKNLEKLIIS